MKIETYGKAPFWCRIFRRKTWFNLVSKTATMKEAYPVEVY